MPEPFVRIPYVIDNITVQLAEVLNALLQRQVGQDVDIATAYFSIRGFELVRHTLPGVRGYSKRDCKIIQGTLLGGPNGGHKQCTAARERSAG